MKLNIILKPLGFLGRMIWRALNFTVRGLYRYRQTIGIGAIKTLCVVLGGFMIYVMGGAIFEALQPPASPFDRLYDPMQGMTIRATLWGGLAGMVLGLVLGLLRLLISEHGWKVAGGALLVVIYIGETAPGTTMPAIMSLLAGILSFYAGAAIMAALFLRITPKTELPNVFGSSRWATTKDLNVWGLLGAKPRAKGLADTGRGGLFLGTNPDDGRALIYNGEMHALTVAPTRSGKDQTAILPNLERCGGSMVVIDPKGESTRRTLKRRLELGGRALAVDPWGITLKGDKDGEGIDPRHIARFNPLDMLKADDPDLPTDAMMMADALVIPSNGDRHWSDEAKGFLAGIILYVITDPREAGQRHLGRVRDIICMPPARPIWEPTNPKEGGAARKTSLPDLKGTLDEIMARMAASDHKLVRAAAHRMQQKADKERSGVISAAQANTHFLDSPRIRESLEVSDFAFSDLKGETPLTVYLVLPLDRLPTFNRWLRLLVATGITQLTREPTRPGAEPVRMILNEFAALGKLEPIETAFGTMAGLGVQLWAVTQDLSQLIRHYGDKSWQTFVANAGVMQYFGSRDYETAKYAEHLTGMTTLKKRSITFGTNWSKGGSSGPQGGGSNWSEGESESV
ncbi:MAG: type IV secretory system conjugative DNA transfer family protein, partial [Pseudomonadota bacterium]